jgi:AmmeMemoRadiSam system protein B
MGIDFLGARHRPALTRSAAIAFGLMMGVLLGVILFFAFRGISSSWSLVSFSGAAPKSPAIVLEEATDASFVADAFRAAAPVEKPDVSKARILLIPHHLVAAREIAALLSSVPQPRRIILLAPDHLGVGATDMTIGGDSVQVNDQIVQADGRIAAKIHSLIPQSSIDERATVKELSMQALLPFIAYAFPKASVTPVLMKIGHDTEERAALAAELQNLLRADSRLLLISTVDFSHYLPESVADFHDAFAEDVITGLHNSDADRVELDSAGVLGTTLEVARNLGLGSVRIHAHTNSLRILESKLSQESTSHFTVSFSPGEIQDRSATTLLFLGDMMFDRTVEDRMKKSQFALYPFDLIRGNEGRMFRGQDAVIGNLEGPITPTYRAPEKENDFAFAPQVASLLKNVGITVVSQANNHTLDQGRPGADDSHAYLEKEGIVWVGDQVKTDPSISLRNISLRGREIALIGLNSVGIPIDDPSVESVFLHASTSAYRIVYMHWGEEYQSRPNESQVAFAHWLIDHGADAVIGSHPHWMQSIESYHGKPIAYSLGNFIFDQDWSTETQYGLMVGLVLRPTGSELSLFPITIRKSQPVLLTGDERQKRLDTLADISDASLSTQIKDGVVRIENKK